MANTVNLRQARKEKTREKKRAEGNENAAKFGQTKAERQQRVAELKRAQARFAAHRREPGPDTGGE